MTQSSGYGQFCPLAMSAEILCNRWTMLVVRELLEGSSRFNEIRRGVPLMSRTLLSARLKELESAGLVERSPNASGKNPGYQLSTAGKALGSVVTAMAGWGQEWIDVEPSIEHVDTDFLMWDIRRNVKILPEFPQRLVVEFHFPDAPEKKVRHWLVFEKSEIDLCYINPGFDVDVEIVCSMKVMVRVWMGWLDFDTAISNRDLEIFGPDRITEKAREWLGLSSFSSIPKMPQEARALRSASV